MRPTIRARRGPSPAEQDAYSKVGIRREILSREEFAEVGHGGTEQFGGFHVEGGGALHPARLSPAGLAEAAERRGANLFAESPVERWERDGARHRLVTPGGTVTAERVVVATNGWTPDGLHAAIDARVWPALSNIVVTRPLTEAELAAVPYVTETPVANTRKLLFYYRLLPDRRFMFGARGDTSGTPEAAAQMRAFMERRIGELFPPWKGSRRSISGAGSSACRSSSRLRSGASRTTRPSITASPIMAPASSRRRSPGRYIARAIGGSNTRRGRRAGAFRRAAAALPASRPAPAGARRRLCRVWR